MSQISLSSNISHEKERKKAKSDLIRQVSENIPQTRAELSRRGGGTLSDGISAIKEPIQKPVPLRKTLLLAKWKRSLSLRRRYSWQAPLGCML